MRALVTGASGFLGSVLVNLLQSHQYEVVPMSSRQGQIDSPKYFEGIDSPDTIDIVFHLAGASFVPKSWETPLDFVRINALGTQNTLDFCKKHKASIVLVSSYMYGFPSYLPVDEKHPLRTPNPYALSKKMAEDLCVFYGDNYGVNFNIARPFNIYGPKQNDNFLIPHIMNQIKHDKQIKVKDLNPKRDYIFVADVAAGILAMGKTMHNKAYNLCSGEAYAVDEIITLCQEVAGTSLPVISETEVRLNEISIVQGSVQLMLEDFNWLPQTSLAEGLALTFKSA